MNSHWAGSLFDHPVASASVDLNNTISSLNESQRAAVMHDEGPILVLAGAGSGKTRVLVTRITRLIAERGIPASSILAVTFTNKAAGEMRQRIGNQLGESPTGMWCGTFHSLGARLLRRIARDVGRETNFTIYDEDDQLGLIKRVMEGLRLDPKQLAPKIVSSVISEAKNGLVSAAEFALSAQDPFRKNIAAIYTELESALQRVNAVSFDDLLVLPVRAMQAKPELVNELQAKFRYVLVDEYQDTNRAQYKFISLIGASHGNVMVVGDDDQSIYGWRGADIRNILDFEQDFSGAKIVRLEDNYRSTPQILKVANAVISSNTERRGKTLRATMPSGEPVMRCGTLDERDEADHVADFISSRLSRGDFSLSDTAILYRTNAQSRAFEDSFRRRGMPYRLVGAVRFYDRREIRDLMAWLKLIANPSDDESFRRAVSAPRRGIGNTSITELAEKASVHGLSLMSASTSDFCTMGLRSAVRSSLSEFSSIVESFRSKAVEYSVDELLSELVESLRYEEVLRAEGIEGIERIDNVRELIAGAAEVVSDEGGEVGLTPLDVFLQQSSLVAGTDALDASADAVTMMTMHNAKGLEYPLVFVTGLEDGLFPLARSIEDVSQLEEERRLFYVGVTRAEKVLVMTHAQQRRRNGEFLPAVPSRFLSEIPKEYVLRSDTRRVLTEGRAWNSGASGDDSRGRNKYGSAGFGTNSFEGRSRLDSGRSSGKRIDSSKSVWHTRSNSESSDFLPEEQSQDAPEWRIGERVLHTKFGTGTIAEFSGSGSSAKVRIDFDDKEVGRKTLVIAQAKLERAWE